MYFRRYFLFLLAIVGLIAIVVALLTPKGTNIPSARANLVKYASTNVVARLTIDGPEGSNQTHQSLQITVGKNYVTYQQFSGYENQLVTTQTYPNNQIAYSAFLHTLYYAGYDKGNSNPSDSDETGVCALGDRYVYELINNGHDIQRYWSTSCGAASTYDGIVSRTLTLFENQVPNYSTLTQNFAF